MKTSGSAALADKSGSISLPSPEALSNAGKARRVAPWGWVALSIAALLLCAVAADEVAYWQLRHQVRIKQRRNALLASIRQMENDRLTHYRFVHKSEGIVRIPLSRARELVLRDYARPSSVPQSGVAVNIPQREGP